MGFYSGKTAIVTGAGFAALKDGSAGSIGYGIATAFAKEGANLVITGRNEKKLNAAKEKLESAYGIEVLIAQRAGVRVGRHARRPHPRAVRPRHLLRPLRGLLLHAGVLPAS